MKAANLSKLVPVKTGKKIKILIIRLKAIGDAILTSAVFRNLRRIYPDCKIDVIVYTYVQDVYKNNPYINKLIILKRKNLSKLVFYFKSFFRRYDIIIDSIDNPTSAAIALFTHAKIKIGGKNKRNLFYTHRIKITERMYNAKRHLKLLEPLGLKDFSDYMPELFIDGNDNRTAEILLSSMGLKNKKLIGIFASAKYITRKYIPEYFAGLAEMIAKNSNYKILFLFGKGDIETLRIILKTLTVKKNIYFAPPDISIGELGGLIKRLNYFITSDTGPKHIATGLNIPTLTIFGATHAQDWNPPDLIRFPIIKNNIKCSPCNKNKCDSLKCMKELYPEDVFKRIKKIIL